MMDENMRLKALEHLKEFLDTVGMGDEARQMKSDNPMEEMNEQSSNPMEEGAEMQMDSGSNEGGIHSEGPTAGKAPIGEQGSSEDDSSEDMMSPKVDIKELMRKHGRTGSGSKGAVLEAGYVGTTRR